MNDKKILIRAMRLAGDVGFLDGIEEYRWYVAALCAAMIWGRDH